MTNRQAITAEALKTWLRDARVKAAGVHAYLRAAEAELDDTHSGAEIFINRRELALLNNLLTLAEEYAESALDQVKKEVERVEG